SVKLTELVANDANNSGPLSNWQSVTELIISPSGTKMINGKKVKTDGKAWQGPREIRNLRWVGGTYTSQSANGSTLNQEDFQKNFNNAIKKSLDQEKRNEP
ncbi:MAG: hypothetical protein ACK47R_08090, partial [Planctomycetia bacterium]